MTATTQQPSYVVTVRRMLRAEMDAQGVGSAALATRLGWPERTLLGYLDGPARLLIDALHAICLALGIETGELLHRAEVERGSSPCSA